VTAPDGCPGQFSLERRDVFRFALLGAYADAGEIHDPERGFNDLIHGLIVYHLTGHRLARAFESDPDVRFARGAAGPELWVEGCRLRWNKVGSDARQRIESSFPRSSQVAAFMAEANQQLSLWESDGEASEPANWILAHVGNPRDGLIRAYLAAPISSSGREVTGWARWIAIYDAAQPNVDLPEAPAPGLPEAVEIEAPEITLIDIPNIGDRISAGS
jgi:hypothetical protein